VIAGIVASPWFLFVLVITGSLMPTSGSAQMKIVSLGDLGTRAWSMSSAVIQLATPWIYPGFSRLLFASAVTSLFVLLFCASKKTNAANLFRSIERVPAFGVWALAFVLLLVVYPTFFWATHFYQRYAAPLVIIFLPVIGFLFVEWRKTVSARLWRFGQTTIVAFFFLWAGLSLHLGRIGNSHAVTAGYVQTFFPAPYKIGAFQSGVVGYFNANTVNLDGKVNGNALRAAHARTLEAYVDSEGIDVIVDWPGYISNSIRADYLAAGWVRCEQSIPNGYSVCFQRLTPRRLVDVERIE
jgi:hypothetical protein